MTHRARHDEYGEAIAIGRHRAHNEIGTKVHVIEGFVERAMSAIMFSGFERRSAARRFVPLVLGLFCFAVFAPAPAYGAVTFRAPASFASSQAGATGITYEGEGGADSNNSDDVQPALPGGTQVGDLLICLVESHDAVAHTIDDTTWPWTRLYMLTDNSGGGQSASLFYKFAAAGEPDPTITHTGGNSIIARCSAFRGVDPTTPFDVAFAPQYSGSDRTVETGSVTTATNGAMLLFALHANNNPNGYTVTTTGGLTWTQEYYSRTGAGSNAAVGLYSATQSTAGAIGPLQATTPNNQPAAESHGVLLALRPAVSGLTINRPANAAAGDVMIASIAVRPSTIAVTPPAGWTLIRQVPQPNANSSVLSTYYRVAGAAEPASYTWTFGGGAHTGAVGGIAGFSGVDTTTPIDDENGVATASSVNHAAPSVATTQSDGMLVTVHELTSSRTWTPPGGMTEAVDIASLTPNNAGGISMEMNYEPRPATGATGTRTASVGGQADSGATQSVALRAAPLICYTDDFNRANGAPGSDWVVSSNSGGFGNPVIFNNRLRLTDASGNVATMAQLQRLFPGAGNRIEVEFDHFAYGGSGADGIAIVFSDSAVSPVPGGYGGSLGYAQRSGINGFAGGWLGIGIDEFGNFSNPTEGRVGGPGFRVDSVAIRGSGAGTSGYAYHAGTGTLAPQVDQNGGAVPPHRYRIIVDHSNGVNAFVSVERNTGSGYVTLVAPYDAKAQPGQAVVPANWLLSYTGSTGGATNVHEIDSLRICATSQAPLIDHFEITVAPSASTCTPQSVTVAAKDAANVTLTGYTGTVVLSTSSSHGDWQPPSVQLNNGAADDGGATYTFTAANNGTVTLSLSNTHADDLTINAVDSLVPSSSSTSAAVSFRDNAFVITNDSVQVAGRNQAMVAALWRRDVSTGNCAIDGGYAGAKNLDAWLTLDGSHPVGAAVPSIGALALPTAAPAPDPASNNLALMFAAGSANFNLSTTDVGKYVLNLRDDTRLYATAIDIGGASPAITTRPFALHANIPGNPGAAAPPPGGTLFTSAGTNFSGTVRAVLWQVGDDGNNDGIPDSGANVADNAVTPSYAWATTLSAIAPFTPATGVVGSIANGAIAQPSFSGGAATVANLQYSEVGSFTLQAAMTDYLNTPGANVTTPNGVVGRFRPAQYGVTASTITPACTSTPPGFTYARQPFTGTMTLQAQTAGGALTRNFRDGFDTLDPATELTFVNNQTAGAYDDTLVGFVAGQTFSNDLGVAKPTGQTNLSLQFRWDMPVQAAVNTTVQLTAATDEVTAVAGAPYSVGATNMRFGRLFLQNAFGSELLPLSMPMRTQYYVDVNTGFVTNLQDNCTSVTTLTLSNNLPPPVTGGTGVTKTINGSITTTGTFAAMASGDAGFSFSAPGAGGDGYVDVTVDLSALPWLQFDWDGNGTHDNFPLGRATFGVYQGSPRHIYLRERY